MPLDSARLPRTATYLDTLPKGIESFKGCEVRSTVFEPHVRDFRRLAAEPDLPGPVADLLSGRLSETPWVPAVVFQVAYLVVRDLGFSDDDAFHRWLYDANQELFDKPLLRNLMKLVSPSLIVMGASKRWTAFHQGSELLPGAVETVDGRSVTLSRLKFPEGLFSHIFLVGLEHAFLAAVTAARAKDPTVKLSAIEPGLATFTASWRR
jgi:hypothetical protein